MTDYRHEIFPAAPFGKHKEPCHIRLMAKRVLEVKIKFKDGSYRRWRLSLDQTKGLGKHILKTK